MEFRLNARTSTQLVLQYSLGVAPALDLPEKVHVYAFSQDREQQRCEQDAEQPKRQVDEAAQLALGVAPAGARRMRWRHS